MITFDYTNATRGRVGKNGLTPAAIDAAVRKHRSAFRAVLAERAKGRYAFSELLTRDDLTKAIEAFVFRACGRFRSLIQIGIGGSSLGARAIYEALSPSLQVSPQVFFIDNIDPEEITGLLGRIDLSSALFHVVSKSGSTPETFATLLHLLPLLHQRLGQDWKAHVAVTTDPQRGPLREFVRKEQLLSFDFPPDVGGRFSALSAAGLLPAAIAGAPIRELIAGAVEVDGIVRRDDPRANPAFMAALISGLLEARGCNIHVLMPYSRPLFSVADWFRQLWAESLGKKGKGSTPVVALGATDQHSQIQLYSDGPQDKLITFLEVERFRRDARIPTAGQGAPPGGEFEGRSLGELLLAEKRGTELALTKCGRPNVTIRIPEITPRAVGGLLYFFEMMTVFAAALSRVNPFDQPAVEAGKKATRAILSGKSLPGPDPKFVIRNS